MRAAVRPHTGPFRDELSVRPEFGANCQEGVEADFDLHVMVRARQTEKNEPSTHTTRTLGLRAQDISYFSGKMECYMRYKELSFRRLEVDSQCIPVQRTVPITLVHGTPTTYHTSHHCHCPGHGQGDVPHAEDLWHQVCRPCLFFSSESSRLQSGMFFQRIALCQRTSS